MDIKKSHLYALLIILFPVLNFAGVFGNYDELVGLIAVCYIWIRLLRGTLDKKSAQIVMLLSAITLIGIVSNIMSGLISYPLPIVVDALWLWKTFACFIFFSGIYQRENIEESCIGVLSKFAKITLILVIATSIIGQMIDIGVTGSTFAFGLKKYGFFWRNGIQTGWLVFCILIILALSECSDKEFRRYFILSYIPLLLTGSSLVYCWVIVSAILFIGMRQDDVFKIRYVILILLITVVFTWGDLQDYFFSSGSSIRKTLIEYGIKIANMYFPLGSGFATYGSEMARRYYSKLYQSFGWTYSWGLGKDSEFLNDNFFAGIIGQFGWIGFALYLGTLYLMFKTLNTNIIEKRIRITALSTIIVIFAVMIGSSSAKSMMGVCTFSVLGIVYGRIKANAEKRCEE